VALSQGIRGLCVREHDIAFLLRQLHQLAAHQLARQEEHGRSCSDTVLCTTRYISVPLMVQIDRRRQVECRVMFPTVCTSSYMVTRSLHAPFESMYCFSRVHQKHGGELDAARRRTPRQTPDTWHMLPLSGGARDVEPLVDARVDGRGRLLLVLGKVELARVGAVIAVRHGGVGAVNQSSACRSTSSNAER